MEKIKCSVPLLTLNSGKYLARCLEQLKDFEDVFLLDGNSTDDTLNIARRFGIPVHKQVETEEKNVRIKNFTQMREKGYDLSRCDWNLQLDSDEFLTPELILEIRKAIDQTHDNKIAFNISKKYIIGDKRIEHAFNYPNYIARLHSKKSGVSFKSGKIVHEQMYIPEDVKILNLKNSVYSEVSPTYSACVKKDKYQLGLMKQSTFGKGAYKSRYHSFRVGWKYFLRAGNILYKSFKVYMKHGYKESLPIGQVMRHVRVHIIMSYWRMKQSLLGKKSIMYGK